MAYTSGMLNKRITIATRAEDQGNTFGKSAQPKYRILGTYWAAETFSRGAKALHEGALDAYDTVMFRLRWNGNIDRWCLIQYLGKWYQIMSCNEDKQGNQIQITAQEMANQNVTIVSES